MGVVVENAPFKMTADYIELLGGLNSPVYAYYQILMLQGFQAIRKHMEELCDLAEIMHKDSSLPCFEKFELKDFKERFKMSISDEHVKNNN